MVINLKEWENKEETLTKTMKRPPDERHTQTHGINLPLFSTVVPAVTFVFLSCRPFVAITTLSTGFVGVEVTSVSWLEQLTVGV